MQRSHSSSRRLSWVEAGTLGVALGLLFPRLYLFAQTSGSLLSWPWQFDYDEGINLNATLQLASGHNIYRHNGPEGFLSAPYPPIFYLLNAPLTWVTGPQLTSGRIFSLIATLAIAVLLALIVRRITGAWTAGVLASALWLSLSPVIVWSTLYKQDMPALALGLGGLAWALTHRDDKRLYVPAILFALAFYTKQSAVSAAAATSLWLLLRDTRLGSRFVLIMLALVPLPFLLGNLILGGGLWEHLVGNHALPWSLGQFSRYIGRLWSEHWALLILGGAALAGMLVALLKRGQDTSLCTQLASPWGLAGLYALMGGASMLLQAGYEGANYNHLLDGLVPSCMLAGLAIGKLARIYEVDKAANPTRHMAFTLGGLAIGAVLLVLQSASFTHPNLWYLGGWPSASRDELMNKLSSLVAATPGDIYSEDAYLLLRNGHRVLYDDPSTFVPLAETGGWDDTIFNQSVRDRRFPLVILQRGSARWTAEGRRALEESYTLKFPDAIDTYEAKLYPGAAQFASQCTLSGDNDSIRLLGHSLGPGASYTGVSAGSTLHAALYWQAAGPIEHNYASYVHLVNDKGEKVAGRDNPQTAADHPTSEWQPSETAMDPNSLPIPTDVPPGKYKLIAGMYRLAANNLKALSPICTSGATYGEAVLLSEVEVK